MKRYLLSIYQPEGGPPPPEILEPLMRNLEALNDEMKANGAWVFGAALEPPGAATVMRPEGRDLLASDGPFAETKEFLGGFTVIQASDRDAALEWGRKLAEVTTLPIEVRPLYS